jgi:tripartite-type tricarboxylate transporter receptor subunit TctC
MKKAFILAGLLALAAGDAAAWTDRPVRFLVPGPAGGTSDLLARMLGEAVSKKIGQPVVVENKPGGGGSLAVAALLAAAPDGNTLLVSPQNVITEVPLVLPVAYDPLRDLKPVAEIGRGGLVLVAGPSAPQGGLGELIAHARANRGKLAYASYSPGTASHFAGLVLNRRANIDLQHVPYKGSPPALNEVMGGQVPLMFDGIPTSLALVRAGRLRALAVAGTTRSALLPQVPTFAELGYPEVAFTNWIGVIASAKVAGERVARIHAALLDALDAPGLRKRLADAGFEASPPTTPAALERAVRADHERNARLVRDFAIKAD